MKTFLCLCFILSVHGPSFAEEQKDLPFGKVLLKMANASAQEVQTWFGQPLRVDDYQEYASPAPAQFSNLEMSFARIKDTDRCVSIHFTLKKSIRDPSETISVLNMDTATVGKFRLMRGSPLKYIADLPGLPAPPAELVGGGSYETKWTIILQDFNKDRLLEDVFIKRQVEPGQ